VSIDNGVVSVRTTSSADTIFLSVIGIDNVTGTGRADANIVPTGHDR
jgi:hypothetical protein